MAIVDLGFRPRKWQEQIYRSLKRYAILVVHRRAGKTLLAVMRLIDAALRCKLERGRYAYIAPELKQAKDIAWDYLRLYAQKVPGTTLNQSELWVQFTNGARIRLYGADNPDSLKGRYFDGVVIDEVAQAPRELWGEVIFPTLADRKGWALFIGTPKGINLFSELYFSAQSDSAWYAQLFTVLQTEVFSPLEIDAFRASMTDNQFRQEMMCDFQASSDNALISLDDALAGTKRVYTEAQVAYAPRIVGVDVAWTGGDRSVIAKRQGLAALPFVVETGLPEKMFSGRVSMVLDDWRPDACFIDVTGGYGGEVLSRLQERGYNAQGVNFAWKPSDPKFLNLRAEMWFKMAAWLKEGGAIPNDPTLLSELCAPIYSNDNASNKLQLESKDKLKARLGSSPDIADALALTWAFPVLKAAVKLTAQGLREAADFDPLDIREAHDPFARY